MVKRSLAAENLSNRWVVVTYALLHEGIELALILNLDELLAAVGRVGNVQLKGRASQHSALIVMWRPEGKFQQDNGDSIH